MIDRHMDMNRVANFSTICFIGFNTNQSFTNPDGDHGGVAQQFNRIDRGGDIPFG